MSLLFFFFFYSPLKGNTRIGVLIVLVRLLAEAYRLVFVHSRAKGILLCVWHTSARPRGSSAVEDGPVPVRSEGERGAFGVGLPPVRTQRGDGLVGKQRHGTQVIVRRRLRTKRFFGLLIVSLPSKSGNK